MTPDRAASSRDRSAPTDRPLPRTLVGLAAGVSLLAVAACAGTTGEGPEGTADAQAYGQAATAGGGAGDDAKPRAEGGLGEIDFPTSASGEAQRRFERGVLLLHSFEYGRAREAFREAQEADRGFALAYWGEALSHDHPLWAQEDLAAAREALDRLAPTREARLAAAPTERERLYLEAVETLFGEGSKAERHRAYAEAMARLSAAYPDDLEAKAFRALALLGTVEERHHETYMRAAALAEEVFRRNPRHPGAVHYLIHAYDDPVHAPLGLRPARVYAEIAPDAVHARHMPSHIFLALGMWDEVVAANRASEEAAVARGGHNFHALHWLAYAHLQRGEREAAREALEPLIASLREGSGDARYYLARARANWLVETGERDGEVAGLEIETEGVGTIAAGADLFADGLVALRTDRPADVRRALEALRERRRAAGGGAETGGGSSADELRVMELELQGLLALAEGRREAGLSRLREAAEAEEAIPFAYGPPRVPMPAHELLGEALLEAGRAAEAAEHFRRALERAPGRALAREGLERAESARGGGGSERAVSRDAVRGADAGGGVPERGPAS